MTNKNPEPRGCLTFLFGFGGGATSNQAGNSIQPTGEAEGNYHSGPGGYEGMGYSGGYAAGYRAEHDDFGGVHEGEA